MNNVKYLGAILQDDVEQDIIDRVGKVEHSEKNFHGEERSTKEYKTINCKKKV